MRIPALLLFALAGCYAASAQNTRENERKVAIIADSDNHFKLPDQKGRVLRLKADEPLLLVVTANPGSEMAKDGAVHGLVIRSQRAAGWDLRLKEGRQEFHLRAPAKPGSYKIECNVICGLGHANMNLKVVVEP
jgi:heme/copper-type cytochrome/quinol oxidase subunit 2